VLGSSLLALIGLSRTGSRLFWRTGRQEVREPWEEEPPRVRGQELAATMLLLGYVVAMGLLPAPVLRYATATAEQLLQPAEYVHQVRDTLPQRRAP